MIELSKRRVPLSCSWTTSFQHSGSTVLDSLCSRQTAAVENACVIKHSHDAQQRGQPAYGFCLSSGTCVAKRWESNLHHVRKLSSRFPSGPDQSITVLHNISVRNQLRASNVRNPRYRTRSSSQVLRTMVVALTGSSHEEAE